jgi:gliding motility-associated-like protein
VQVLDDCGNSYNDTLVIAAANFPFSVGADTIKCNADTLLLSATPGFTNYQWQNNYSISSTTGANISVYPLVDTFYYASAEKWPGCVVRDTIHITVNTSPVINLGADTSLCAGQSLTINAGGGFANYIWNTGASLESISVNQAGQYYVVGTAANGCISSDILALLQVTPLPVFSLGADTTLCNGQTLQLNVTLPNAIYQWQDAGNGNAYTISQAGQYTLAVTQQGCTGRDSLLVAYKPSPIVQLGSDSLLCEGQVLVLDAGNPGAMYQWQDGAIGQQSVQSSSGTYSVLVNLNGCTFSDTISLRFDPKPFFNLGKDSSICSGNQLALSPKVNTVAQYLWQDGSTGPGITVSKAGLYSLRVMNHCGSYADSLLLTEGLCRLLMPNAFTPNNDGVNDVFRVKYPFAVKDFSFIIFNRYGQPVFETSDINKGWDGTFKSSPQGNGAYVWIIRLINTDESVESQTGTVLLLR